MRRLPQSLRQDVYKRQIENLTRPVLYQAPLMLEENHFSDIVCRELGLQTGIPDLTEWEELLDRICLLYTSKPGIGGHLPGTKIVGDISKTRMIPEGSDAISPAPHLSLIHI